MWVFNQARYSTGCKPPLLVANHRYWLQTTVTGCKPPLQVANHVTVCKPPSLAANHCCSCCKHPHAASLIFQTPPTQAKCLCNPPLDCAQLVSSQNWNQPSSRRNKVVCPVLQWIVAGASFLKFLVLEFDLRSSRFTWMCSLLQAKPHLMRLSRQAFFQSSKPERSRSEITQLAFSWVASSLRTAAW